MKRKNGGRMMKKDGGAVAYPELKIVHFSLQRKTNHRGMEKKEGNVN